MRGFQGIWCMALRDEHGHWNQFQMDLGNSQHRHSFKSGRVPATDVEKL